MGVAGLRGPHVFTLRFRRSLKSALRRILTTSSAILNV